MGKFLKFLFAVCVCFSIAGHAQADYQFNIVGLNSTYAAGSSGTFDIVFNVTSPNTSPLNNIQGYTAGFQTNNGGVNQGLTFTAVDYVATGAGGVNLSNANFIGSVTNAAGTRLAASNSGSPTFSAANGEILARVSFTSDAGLAANTLFTINTRTTTNDLTVGGSTPSGFTELGSGSFTISAVPEPSSMVLAGLAIAGGVGIRRRFRKKLVS